VGRIAIHAVPNARSTEGAGRHGAALKIRLAARPEEGRANAELLRFVAETLGVPKSSVRLARGASSREKVIEVDGLDDGTLGRLLGGAPPG
jgi:uncharacterized protein (TIGR00251 family)